MGRGEQRKKKTVFGGDRHGYCPSPTPNLEVTPRASLAAQCHPAQVGPAQPATRRTCEQGGGRRPGQAQDAQQDCSGGRGEARGRWPASADPRHRPAGCGAASGTRRRVAKPAHPGTPAPAQTPGAGQRRGGGEQDGRPRPAGESHPTAPPGEGTVGAGKAAVNPAPRPRTPSFHHSPPLSASLLIPSSPHSPSSGTPQPPCLPPPPRRTHAQTGCQPQTPFPCREMPGHSLPGPAEYLPAQQRRRGAAPAAARREGRGKGEDRGEEEERRRGGKGRRRVTGEETRGSSDMAGGT